MYGLITKLTAYPGRRDELALILLDPGIRRAGCHSYVVAFDAVEPDSLWVTEVWINAEAHQAALCEDNRAKLRLGMALVAVFGETTLTRPIGGVGL